LVAFGILASTVVQLWIILTILPDYLLQLSFTAVCVD
jgi:hypothetical protein